MSIHSHWARIRECECRLVWGHRVWVLTGQGSESVSVDQSGIRECECWPVWNQRVWVLTGLGSESVSIDWLGIRECEYSLPLGWNQSVSVDQSGIRKCEYWPAWDQRVWVLTGLGSDGGLFKTTSKKDGVGWQQSFSHGVCAGYAVAGQHKFHRVPVTGGSVGGTRQWSRLHHAVSFCCECTIPGHVLLQWKICLGLKKEFAWTVIL